MIAELEARRERRHATTLPTPVQRRAIRIAYGVSQNDMAEVLKVTRLTLSMWERGQTIPNAENTLKYGELLDLMRESNERKGEGDDQG